MSHTRRDLLRAGGAALSAGAVAVAQPSPQQASDSRVPYRNHFGDLHNHIQIGYAQGTLPRAFEIARNHLDFYAFTSHSYWPDMGSYDGRIETKWRNGFQVANGELAWSSPVWVEKR